MILEAVCAPIVSRLTGEIGRRDEARTVLAGAEFKGRTGWTWFVPAEIRTESGGERAFPIAIHSAHTSLLARAHGYAILTENAPTVAAGDVISIVRFSAGGRA